MILFLLFIMSSIANSYDIRLSYNINKNIDLSIIEKYYKTKNSINNNWYEKNNILYNKFEYEFQYNFINLKCIDELTYYTNESKIIINSQNSMNIENIITIYDYYINVDTNLPTILKPCKGKIKLLIDDIIKNDINLLIKC